jgi:hypothetical protein
MVSTISVRVPLYFTESSKLSEVCRAFKEGQSHMGIVCESGEAARENRNLADHVNACLTGGHKFEPTYESLTKIQNLKVLGILTMENVIEKIL